MKRGSGSNLGLPQQKINSSPDYINCQLDVCLSFFCPPLPGTCVSVLFTILNGRDSHRRFLWTFLAGFIKEAGCRERIAGFSCEQSTTSQLTVKRLNHCTVCFDSLSLSLSLPGCIWIELHTREA